MIFIRAEVILFLDQTWSDYLMRSDLRWYHQTWCDSVLRSDLEWLCN